jgi:hypothetical protein
MELKEVREGVCLGVTSEQKRYSIKVLQRKGRQSKMVLHDLWMTSK